MQVRYVRTSAENRICRGCWKMSAYKASESLCIEKRESLIGTNNESRKTNNRSSVPRSDEK
jgi:hypothetical protein